MICLCDQRSLVPRNLLATGVSESAFTALGWREFVDNAETRLNHGHEHHLRDFSPGAMVKESLPRFQHDTKTCP